MYAIIDDVISQVETNFLCLHLWTFFSEYALENNLSTRAKNIKLKFKDGRWFILSGYKIKDSLENLYIQQEKENFFFNFHRNQCFQRDLICNVRRYWKR